MKSILFGMTALGAALSFAEDAAVRWPADFNEKVAAHIAAVAPSAAQTGVASFEADVVSLVPDAAASGAIGTAADPFSTFFMRSAATLPMSVNTLAPGFLLFFR